MKGFADRFAVPNGSDALRITIKGTPTADDLAATLIACYSKHSFQHSIWDFRAASLANFSAHGFCDVARAGAAFLEKRGSGARTAMLVSNQAEIRLLRAFADRARTITPITFKASANEKEALDWLGQAHDDEWGDRA
ncbi:MAG: hypothetical protein ACPGOV_01060 [Magnetovibrionaceae bacterium]